jgi:hypothetical protein
MMEFDFNAFAGIFDEQKEKSAPKKDAKKSGKKSKKDTTAKEKPAGKKSGIPEKILNATFLKNVKLFTAFGCAELISDSNFTTEMIKERLLKDQMFREVTSKDVVFLSGGVDDDKEVVFAALNQHPISLNGSNTDTDVDISAGGYIMHLLKGANVTEEKRNWPEWMSDGQFYKVSDQVYGIMSGKSFEKMPKTLIGYEDFAGQPENGKAEELLCAIANVEKLPEYLKVSFCGTQDEGYLQMVYTGPGSITGSNVPKEKTETAEEKEKRLLEEAVVKLPVTVELPWGGGCTQQLTADDFDGKTEVNLGLILAKLESVYTLLGTTVKYRAFYVQQQDLVHVSMIESGMRQKGSFCPF